MVPLITLKRMCLVFPPTSPILSEIIVSYLDSFGPLFDAPLDKTWNAGGHGQLEEWLFGITSISVFSNIKFLYL